MSRKAERARARLNPQLGDAKKALVKRREGAMATALRLRGRYASRAAAATLEVARHCQAASDALTLVVFDGEKHAGDWRYAKDAHGKEIIVDRIDQAGASVRAAVSAWLVEVDALDQLAKADAMIETYSDQGRGQDVEGPTRAMLDRMRERMGDPMQRLVDLGRLTDDDLSDAREIAAIVRYATDGMGPSMMRFEVKPEGDAGGSARTAAEAAEWNGLLHAHVYRPWCVEAGPASKLVIAMAVDGVSIETLRRQYGARWTTVLDQARAALLAYRRRRRAYVRTGAGQA